MILQVVVRLQRCFRAKLAQKRVQRVRQALGKTETASPKPLQDREVLQWPPLQGMCLVDSWQPGGVAAGVAALRSAPATAAGKDQPPKRDYNLERLEKAGLVPFYW